MRVPHLLTCAMRVWSVFLLCRLAWGVLGFDGSDDCTSTVASVAPALPALGFQSSLSSSSWRKASISVSFVSPPPNDNTDAGSQQQQRLLELAKKLRDEARILEGELRRTHVSLTSTRIPKIVTDLKDSTWTISYRFTSQPNDDNGASVLSSFYSGKFTILLQADGYSELVAGATAAATDSAAPLEIVKIWGWDEEYSQEQQQQQQQQQQYLLFSMDVRLPKSDPRLPDSKERYYFQARIDRKNNNNTVSGDSGGGEISLKAGTVTVKKDVAEKTNGQWGLFRVAGILTRFRYVGDFIAKPL